jgi:hypothetical protein
MTHNNYTEIDYTDQQLRVLIEEYITQQRRTFTLQGVCNYVLYLAMEDSHTCPLLAHSTRAISWSRQTASAWAL